ncbi:uncharacterized protein RHO25_000239 [Cercospora beticola]|uniref:Uncharacterized protein n=1 Tax=Cercospora beticola TaxID=122368 RepID=A0ABZ0N7Y7_CERBT|nr:hypothetical protein RHO25_000239 [Cercospora beticola]
MQGGSTDTVIAENESPVRSQAVANSNDHAPSVMFSVGFPRYDASHHPPPALLPNQTTKLSKSVFEQICRLGLKTTRGPKLTLVDIRKEEDI